MSNHSGHSNAFTALDDTNYFFEVGHDHLEGALDRFAQFFISPLFLDSCTDREIRAVDSENKKNLNNDKWRLYQLEKSLSNPDHPYSKFGTGNLITLQEEPMAKGLNIRDELLRFHHKYYSANVMRLVILGREPLDQLEKWVRTKFGMVSNRNLPAPSHGTNIWSDSELKTHYFVKPVKDIQELELTFPFPDQQPLHASKPGVYLSHLLGHEGEGSIYAYLKRKGWVQSLYASPDHITTGIDFFKVNMELTPEGVLNYESIIEAVFRYLYILRSKAPEEWIWREIQTMAEAAFRFDEKAAPSSFTSHISGTMQQEFPPEWILSGPILLREFDAATISESLSSLRPDNFRFHLVSNTVPGNWDKKEKHYGTEYKLESLSDRLQKSLQSMTNELIPQDLHLPHRNKFIPDSLNVAKKSNAQPLKQPYLIQDSDRLRIWHKKDDRFWVPRVNSFFTISSPISYTNADASAKSYLYVSLVKDALKEYSYDALVAGLSYHLRHVFEGIWLGFDGFNDKLSVLLNTVLEKMVTLEVDPARFAVLKDEYIRKLKNEAFKPPVSQAIYYTQYMTSEILYTPEEKLAALEHLEASDVQEFIPRLLAQVNIEALVHGNFKKDEALALSHAVDAALKGSPASRVPRRSLELPKASHLIAALPVPNEAEMNSGIDHYIAVGLTKDVYQRARLELFAQIVREPAFDQLRTKEQLGYLVWSGTRVGPTHMGFHVAIQSEQKPQYLESRIDSFLASCETLIQDMTPDAYEEHVTSLINKKLEKDKNLSEESSRFWRYIEAGTYDFDRGKQLCAN